MNNWWTKFHPISIDKLKKEIRWKVQKWTNSENVEVKDRLVSVQMTTIDLFDFDWLCIDTRPDQVLEFLQWPNTFDWCSLWYFFDVWSIVVVLMDLVNVWTKQLMFIHSSNNRWITWTNTLNNQSTAETIIRTWWINLKWYSWFIEIVNYRIGLKINRFW